MVENLHAGVVGLDDLLVALAPLGPVIDAGHAHAHAVPFTAAVEGDGPAAGQGLASRLQAAQGGQQGQPQDQRQYRQPLPDTFLIKHSRHVLTL